MILVDTSIWSLALRRRRRDLNASERRLVFCVRDMVIAGDAAVIPLIRQEVLSGLALKSQFEAIRSQLAAITTLSTPNDMFILAAEFFNTCRRGGLPPGAIDMTICAAAYLHGVAIFSGDPDFVGYAKHLPIQLFHV
jgi:predicted nucleic acid-binding protein